MNVNLRDRKMVLKRVIKPVKRMFEVVVGHETTNVDEIFKEFDKAMVKNEEGVIIKQMNSVYIPNDRGTSWIKLKGEYIEGMYDTLDLLILGGYFGEGRVRIGVANLPLCCPHLHRIVGRRLDRAHHSLLIGCCQVS